jgi:DNA polymerase V
MTGAGINSGDILVVDRSLEAKNRSIIVAVVSGEFTVKRLIKKGDSCQLVAENANYQAIEVTPAMDFEVWGCVTSVIHQV